MIGNLEWVYWLKLGSQPELSPRDTMLCYLRTLLMVCSGQWLLLLSCTSCLRGHLCNFVEGCGLIYDLRYIVGLIASGLFQCLVRNSNNLLRILVSRFNRACCLALSLYSAHDIGRKFRSHSFQ